MLSVKCTQYTSSIPLVHRSCTSLTHHSIYFNSNRRNKKRKDRPRNPYEIEDPVSSMDMAYLEPKVKSWKHWKWNYNSLSNREYRKLKGIRASKLDRYQREDAMPYWFDRENPKQLNVIFIRNMDEYLAGQRAKVHVGLYRNWLWPNKIAVPASDENIQRWQHLNLERRQQRETQQKMKSLSSEITQVRFEMKIRKDPETEEVYSSITKPRIARKLLLMKRITVHPSQIVIRRLTASIFSPSSSSKDKDAEEGGDGTLEVIHEAGSYTVELMLDENYGFPFEFRLNVRYNEIEKSNRTPFALTAEDDEDDDEEDEREIKSKKAKDQEMRTALKKWSRAKHANQMLDHLLRKSRYSQLYSVSKLDLTPKRSTERKEARHDQRIEK